MRSILIAVPFMLIAIAPANAGMSVIGNSLGQECYEDTLLAPNPQRNADALEVCDRAVLDNSVNAYNRAANHVNRAEIRIRVGNFTGALEDADFAIAQNSKIGEAHLNRGAALIGLGRHEDALAEINLAIGAGIERVQRAYFDRALVEETLGDVRSAYFDYKRAADLQFAPAQRQLVRFTVTGKSR